MIAEAMCAHINTRQQRRRRAHNNNNNNNNSISPLPSPKNTRTTATTTIEKKLKKIMTSTTNVSQKRPRPNSSSSSSSSSSTSNYFANLAAKPFAAPSKDDRKSASAGGTRVLALVESVFKRLCRSEKKNTSWTELSMQVRLGRPDVVVEDHIGYNETEHALVFRMHDPDELDAAAKEAKAQDRPFDASSIERTLVDTYDLSKSIYVRWSAPGLPGNAPLPAVVRFDGLISRPWKDDSGKWRFELKASNVTVVNELAGRPAAIADFLNEVGMTSPRYVEKPLYSELDTKLAVQALKRRKGGQKARLDVAHYGDLHTFPICSMEDHRGLQQAYPKCTDQHGCWVAFRSTIAYDSLFYMRASAQVAGGGGSGSTKTPATYVTCQDYNIWMKLNMSICQWDTDIDPAQIRIPDIVRHKAVRFEPEMVAWPEECWSMVVTKPEHWFLLGPHLRFMRGMWMWRPDLIGTSNNLANRSREAAVKSMAGLATGTTQMVNAANRGMLINVMEYLGRAGLPLSLKGACEVLGLTYTEDGPIICRGKNGTSKDKNGNAQPLEARNKEVVCLNEYDGDLWALNDQTMDYYAITCLMPRTWNEQVQIEALVPKMSERDVIQLCKFSQFGTSGAPDATKNQNVVAYHMNCSQPCSATPLVFAIVGPTDDTEMRRWNKGRELVTRQWREGPSVLNRLATDIIEPLPQDELDLVDDDVDVQPPPAKKQRAASPAPPKAVVLREITPACPMSDSGDDDGYSGDDDDDDGGGSDSEEGSGGAAPDADGDMPMLQ